MKLFCYIVINYSSRGTREANMIFETKNKKWDLRDVLNWMVEVISKETKEKIARHQIVIKNMARIE